MDPVTASILVGLLLSALTMVLSELLKPKPKFEDARPAGIGDFQFPTATEGRVVPIVWGRVKLAGPNVVWWGDLRQVAISKTVRTGLWSSTRLTTGFRYYVGIQMGLCRGPIDAVKRVWIGDVVVFEGSVPSGLISIASPGLFGGDEFGSGGIEGVYRIHNGAEDQATSAYLAGFQSPLPAYRGTCYAVWEGGYIGNSTSIKPFAFEIERCPNQLGLPSGQHIVNGMDANPAAVLYEIYTDTDWGLGFSSGDIDIPSFLAAGATLYAEGNGWSMCLDNVLQARDMIREVLRQVDGVVSMDPITGRYKLTLCRGGYNVNTIRQLTDCLEVMDYSRATWDETSNQVRVQFADRDKNYQDSFSQAHDLANQRLQGGELVTVTQQYPGVKTRALATNLASRSIRELSVPLVHARVIVDRSFWDVFPGEMIAWTDTVFGFAKLPMRVLSVDFGSLLDGKIVLDLLQDIYQFSAAFFGDQGLLWTGTTTNVDPFLTAEQRAFEAPWALVRRDPDLPDVRDRIFATARRVTGGEMAFKITERHAAGAPAGAFSLAGEVVRFVLIGQLKNALSSGPTNPMTVAINTTPDTKAALQAAFSTNPAPSDIGQNLLNLLLVDDEFMAATGVVDQTTYLDLTSTYRGMLDTAPAAHLANTRVFLVFVGAGISEASLPAGNNVEVKLLPRSRSDEVLSADAVTIAFAMTNRTRLPYPPVDEKLNTSLYPASVNFDALKSGGATLDDRGIEVAYTRRDYRTFDEVDGLLRDASLIASDFPALNSTKYKAKIIKDPAGTPVTLFETAFNAGEALIFLSRTKILRNNAGAKPATARVEVTARHTFEAVVRDALQVLGHSFSLAASTLDDDTNMGVLAANAVGAVYTAPVTGTYVFTIGTALATGAVQARVNGGAFVTIIAAGNTTGNLLLVVAGDSIEIKHTQGGTVPTETFLEVDAPGSGLDAYAVLTF